MESPYTSHSRSERSPDKKDSKETDKKKEKDKDKSRFEKVTKGISELLFGKRERNARVNTEQQSFSEKLRELFSSKRVETQAPANSEVRRERAASESRPAVSEQSNQPPELAEHVSRRTQEAPRHDVHGTQEQREARGGIDQEVHRPDETLRAKATRRWRQLKLSIREVFSRSRSAETVKQPAQETIQQSTDIIESDSDGSDSHAASYSEAPRPHPESRQRDIRRRQEAYYVRERDSSQLAALSVAAILKNRAERREREQLEKEVQELSEEVKRQEAIIESERHKTRAMWGEHQRPIERRAIRTDTIQSEINNNAQLPQQSIEANMQPDITPNPVQNTVVERAPKPITTATPEVIISRQNITEQTHQSSAQPEITQRQEYADVESKTSNNYTRVEAVTDYSPVRSVETNNIASSPEQLDSRRRFQNQVNATVNQTNDRSVSSKAISPKPRSISDRTSELTQKTKRIYGDSSPASIWTAIIIGWGLFFVVMVWLLRNVFAIL